MKIIRFCIKHISSKSQLLIYTSVYVLHTLLTLALPYLSGRLIDILVYSDDFAKLLNYCLYIAAISVIRLLLSYCIGIIYAGMFVNTSYGISRFVVHHIHDCPVSKTDRIDPAYYNQRISQDAGAIVEFSVSTIVGVLSTAIEFTAAVAIIFTISPLIALITVILLSAYILFYCLLRKPLYERGRLNREDQAVYFSKMYEQLHYTKFVKAHSLKSFFLERLHYSFNKFRNSFMKHQRVSVLFRSLDGIILAISQLALYAIGGYQVMRRVMTIGSFTLISNFFSKLVNAASFFFSIGSSYQNALISYNRILEILLWEEEREGDEIPQAINSITMSGVGLNYGDNQVLNGKNLEFLKGNLYVIAGRNGSGKSTLSRLLLGLYKNEYEGSIKINGIPIEDIDMAALRGNTIGYIEQEPRLFTDTIEKNTLLWREGPPESYACVREMKLLDFVSQIPEGWGSMITPKNNNLSGGEKQRIALARLLIADCGVIILDEPTSSLDKNMAQSLIEYLMAIKKDRIIIVITHDERFMRICDEVISL